MEAFARETEPIAIPWGGQGERLTLNLPGGWPRPETVWPDLSGILSDYPRGAEGLRDRILEQGGALVTEYLPRESYSAENFVKRNRLQAALGKLLVPLEWNFRSGTAHTVRYATSMGRPIACLRLPDWTEDRVVLSKACGGDRGRTFTVPGQEPEFRQFVGDALRAAPRSEARPGAVLVPPTNDSVVQTDSHGSTAPASQPSLFNTP